MPVSTVQLSQGGEMMIIGATPNPIPPTVSTTKMKRRGKVKNWSRRDLLLKQKEIMDKVLRVDARIADLRNIFDGMEEPQRYSILMCSIKGKHIYKIAFKQFQHKWASRDFTKKKIPIRGF